MYRFHGRVLTTAMVGALAVLAASNGPVASASTLVFDATPVTDAVAQIDKLFHITIEIKPGIDADGVVSFAIADADSPGGRLQAINSLATALGGDYQKVFVVSKIADDSASSDPVIDVDAPVVFSDTDQSAKDAIETVAAIDDANVQFYTPVHGSLMLTDKEMSAPDAARELARQTHTRWKAYYAIIPRRHGLVANGGKVIGYTDGGQPITEMAIQSFRKPLPPPVPETKDSANGTTAQKAAEANAPAQQAPEQNPMSSPYNAYLPFNGLAYGSTGTGYSEFPNQTNPNFYGSGYGGAPSNPAGNVFVPNAVGLVNGQMMVMPQSSSPGYGYIVP
jgi:hypothetical protein